LAFGIIPNIIFRESDTGVFMGMKMRHGIFLNSERRLYLAVNRSLGAVEKLIVVQLIDELPLVTEA
jgi:hypothetical protein